MADRSFNVSRRPETAVMPDTPVKPMIGISEVAKSARTHRRGCSMGGAFPSKSPLFPTAAATATPKSPPSNPFGGFVSKTASKTVVPHPNRAHRRTGHLRSASERIPGTRNVFLNEITIRPTAGDPDDVFEGPSESPIRPLALKQHEDQAPAHADALPAIRRDAHAQSRLNGRPAGVVPVCPVNIPNERSAESSLPRPVTPLDHDAPMNESRGSLSMDSPNNMFARPRTLLCSNRSTPCATSSSHDESSECDSLSSSVSPPPSSLGHPGAWVESTPTLSRRAISRPHEPIQVNMGADVPNTPMPDKLKWYEATQSPTVLPQREKPTRPRHSQPVHVQTPVNRMQSTAFAHTEPVGRFRSSRTSQFEEHFAVEGVLGAGEFSEVIKVREKATGFLSAVKRMKRPFLGPKDRVRRLEEVDALCLLKEHRATWRDPWFGAEGVIDFLDAWEEEGYLYLQTELCPLGSLAFVLTEYGRQVGALDEARLWKILAELSAGVHFIHQCGVLHLDLKPANILITEVGTLKISDFGMATRWPRCTAREILAGSHLATQSTSLLGDAANDASALASIHAWPADSSSPDTSVPLPVHATVQRPRRRTVRMQRRPSPVLTLEREGDREYIAPEVIFESKYGKPADIFSLGLILLEAACSVEIPDNGAPWHKLRCNDFSDVNLDTISPALRGIITSMLSAEPSRRPTAADLVEMPVLETVRHLMRQGLRADELDQLPSLCTEPTPHTPRTLPSSKYYEAPHIGALDTKRMVVKIRGALIQEDEAAFLAEVLHTADVRDASSPDTSTSLMTEDSLQPQDSCTQVSPVVHTYAPPLLSASEYLQGHVAFGMDIDKTFPVG